MIMYIYSVYPNNDTFDNVCKLLPNEKWNNLLSFAYYNKSGWDNLVLHSNNLLIDSGAFTYMNTHKTSKGIHTFFKRYLNFVREKQDIPNIRGFIEFDVGSITGMDYVYHCREELENITDKIIPVFHGEYMPVSIFKQMIKDYDYIALGGLVRVKKPNIIKFNEYALRKGKKIHLLGLTGEKFLKQSHFYSCDSSSYIQSKYGCHYRFTPEKSGGIPIKNSKMITKKNSELRTKNYLNSILYQRYYADYWKRREGVG